MNRSFYALHCAVLIFATLWVASQALGQHKIEFERIQLSDQFYAEGGAIGDFDGDGHGDVVVGPWIYWGPDFQSQSRIYEGEAVDPVGYSENFLMDSGDVDQDGRMDIFVLGFPGKESWWFENPGAEMSRGLWKRHVILESVDNESPLMADIDGDGFVDLVCSSGGHYGFASHAGQDPRGLWKFHKISPDNSYHRFTHGLGVGDVNGDGHFDLLEKDGWWQNPGKPTDDYWTFHPFQFSPGGGAQMFAVDLDGDGRNEIVTGLAGHGYGLVYYKPTSDEFTDFQRFDIMTDDPQTSPVGLAVSQLHALAIADMNGDGVPDIVTGKRWWAHANQDPGHEQPATLLWIETQRIGERLQFLAHVIDNSSGVGTDITVGDINGDGLPDILSGTKRGTHLFLQRPEGLSQEQNLFPEATIADPFGHRPAMEVVGVKDGFVPAINGRALNWDFRSTDLLDWEIRGPIAQGAVKDGWIDTGSQHPDWIGEVISRPFQVSHPKLSFLVSGSQTEEAFVEVISERSGRQLGIVTGSGLTEPSEVTIDLSQWVGELVRIRIVDHSKSGFIRCGGFLLNR